MSRCPITTPHYNARSDMLLVTSETIFPDNLLTATKHSGVGVA